MICVDSSIVLKLLIEESDSEAVSSLWEKWTGEGQDIYAPYLLHYEIYNIIRNKTHRKIICQEEQKRIFEVYHAFDIKFIADTELMTTAISLANRFNLPAIYDAVYLALAQKMSLEFWTADLKLARTVSKQLPFVRSLS